MEQAALYSAIKTQFDSDSPWYLHGLAADNIITKPVEAYLCPSEPNAHDEQTSPDITSSSRKGSLTSYHGCVGDFFIPSNTSDTPRGIYQMDKTVNFAAIIDGTSNTIMVGECIIMAWSGKQPIRGGVVPMTNPALTKSSNLARCMGAANDGQLFDTDNTVGTYCYHFPGRIWAQGYLGATYFATAMPPNGFHCSSKASAMGVFTGTASSYHRGGANFAMADGSVKFVSDTVDVGNPSQSVSMDATNAIGESPWGIWGAMGSLNGGESKAL